MRISRNSVLLGTVALAAVLATPSYAQEEESAGFLTNLGQIIFGAGAEKVAIDVPQAVTVIDEEEIEKESPDTIGDIVKNVPGVTTVGSESFFGESLNIRGIGAGGSADEPKIVMTIDGVSKYFEKYRLGSMFTDPTFFKRVEVLRGPSSSTLYGAGAIAGVVASETKDASDFIKEDGDPFAFFQKLEYQNNGDTLSSTSIMAFRPSEDLEFMIGYNHKDRDNIEDGAGEEIPGTNGTLESLIAKGTYYFGDAREHSLEASYQLTHTDRDDAPYNETDSTFSWGTVDREIRDATAYLKYGFDSAQSDLIDLSVQLSYSDTTVKESDAQGTFIPAADSAYEEWALKIENTAEWSGANYENFLTTGIGFSKQNRRAVVSELWTSPFGGPPALPGDGFSYHPQAETKTLSFYAQNEFIWNDRLTVIAGGRVDKQDTTPNGDTVDAAALQGTSKTGSSATLAAHYKINNNWSVFGSASYTERLPTVDEIYDTRANTIFDATSTPIVASSGRASFDLDTETSKNIELGFSYQNQDVFSSGDELTFKALAFRNNIDGEIATNYQPIALLDPNAPNKINLGRTRHEGFELEAAYESEKVFGSLAYSRVRKTDLDNSANDLRATTPADSASLTLGYRPIEALDLSWRMNYAAEVEGYTPEAITHDLFARWAPEQGVLEGAELHVGVHNVFDLDYKTHLASSSAKSAGRQISFGISKTF